MKSTLNEPADTPFRFFPKNIHCKPAIRRTEVGVVGAGIVGLAIAYAAVKKGKKVVVFERNAKALGASIRNFGLLWPIGQPQGKLFERAIRSRKTWDELAEKAGFWKNDNGSLHLAYNHDELAILEEFSSLLENKKDLTFLCKEEVLKMSPVVNPDKLLAGIVSKTEATVDPREALLKISGYLAELGVEFRYETTITDISYPKIRTQHEIWQLDEIFVCSGADFETLYPREFAASGITKCKLQMMRTVSQSPSFHLGPTICGGLTLTHYSAFKNCNSLQALKERFERESPELVKWGIHVMVTQNGIGELVIGDSHEYGLSLEPFDKEEINHLILSYLTTFTSIPNLAIDQKWHGIYPKLEGKTELIMQSEPGVTIVNGLGGAGMTLSFGLAQELLNDH